MRVYNAAIKDRAVTYAIFFVFFCVHIIFCVWSAVSPPLPFSNDWSHTGFICGIKAFGSNTFTGIIYVVGASLWTLETLWSIWCLKVVRTCHLVILTVCYGTSTVDHENVGSVQTLQVFCTLAYTSIFEPFQAPNIPTLHAVLK